jgi:hypothetical protein
MFVLLLSGFLAEDDRFRNLARTPIVSLNNAAMFQMVPQECGNPVGEQRCTAFWPFLCFLLLRQIDKQETAPILARSDHPCA